MQRKPQNNGPRGRSNIGWKDQIIQDINEMGLKDGDRRS